MMKSTGIVRKVDELGRVVIPIELRRTLGIGEKDALEIYVDGERIMLKKYEPACIFCGRERFLLQRKNCLPYLFIRNAFSCDKIKKIGYNQIIPPC
jgi:AbrB family transcriptional regulator, transcriptional pleiotropic regulator of transition state genes